jgi:hypothetical protein
MKPLQQDTATGERMLQQLSERRRSSLMQGSAEAHLNSFQIQTSGLLLLGEDTPQHAGYFARDFLVDRVRRFFS